MERTYNFCELINYTDSLNQLSVAEYGKNGLKFDHLHKK
jgi:hypothetical protein